ERRREPDHLLDLLASVRHHRQRADGECRIGGLVHDDVVRDLVDERLRAAELAEGRARRCGHCLLLRSRTSTGPSPAPISTSPLATAVEATAAALRAASSRSSPRARRAAGVAEWVQPAPGVAATACRAPGISWCSEPSKRWSTAPSPCPPVTTTAAEPRSWMASASSVRVPWRPASTSASGTFGVT